MKKRNVENKPSHITRGNVFDDLGLTPYEICEAKIKSEIWRAVIDRIDSVRYTQSELVGVLKVHQPEVSHLLNGKISRFSVAKLISFALRLDLQPQIKFTTAKPMPTIRAVAARPGKTRELTCV